MDLLKICGAVSILTLILTAGALPEKAREIASSTSHQTANTSVVNQSINSNSVLVALLDSHYTELAELVEKALLLQTLENEVGRHNITIFAPRNEALERDLDPEFKRFLLEPGNLKSLQKLLMFHVIPKRIHSSEWLTESAESSGHRTLAAEHLVLHRKNESKKVDLATLIHPDAVIRPDGVIHGIERLLIPRSVQEEFNKRRSLISISAVLPEGAPEVDPRTHRLKKPASPAPAGAPPALPIYDAMAPGPSLAPAPAPGPGGPHHKFDGMSQVKDFIQTLVHYGGYNEMADILVNLTSLATEMGRLVSEGYVITVLAPNDEAMAKLTTDQLSEPGAPEQIMYYHMIPEYQTEESMYNAVRRFGKVRYDTLRLPHKVTAQEADGSVKFGHGDGSSAYLFDPDIYTDGRISVQGIDEVLFPPEDKQMKLSQQFMTPHNPSPKVPSVVRLRRVLINSGDDERPLLAGRGFRQWSGVSFAFDGVGGWPRGMEQKAPFPCFLEITRNGLSNAGYFWAGQAIHQLPMKTSFPPNQTRAYIKKCYSLEKG